MESYYNYLSVKADNFLWLLQDKALEITGEAIEESKDGFIIRTEQATEPIKSKLATYAKELEKIMAESITLEFCEDKLKNQDWITTYKNSVSPIECGEYYIHPSWFSDKKNKINIIIDPALAFGSGHHESTFGCLEAFLTLGGEFSKTHKGDKSNSLSVKNIKKDSTNSLKVAFKGKKLLDVGCGSGILSICAKKSGAVVWACDTDENAISATKDNALKNNITLDEVFLGSLNAIPKEKGEFDIVVANILADIIVALPLESYVKKGGFLVLSGILEKYTQKVIDKFRDFTIISKKIDKEWATLVLQNKG